MRGSEGAVAYPPERDRGSHEKRRTATTAPARPHAASTARWPGRYPLPVTAGLKASAIAVAKWRNGKNHPSRSTIGHAGGDGEHVGNEGERDEQPVGQRLHGGGAPDHRRDGQTERREGRHADDERHHGGRQAFQTNSHVVERDADSEDERGRPDGDHRRGEDPATDQGPRGDRCRAQPLEDASLA